MHRFIKTLLTIAFPGFIFMMSSCKGGFTPAETEIIGKHGDGIMRLYTVDDPQDSELLRSRAAEITNIQMFSRMLPILQERMLATVNDPENPGVGIAAPQVGLPYRVIAVQRLDKEGEPFEFYINPEIISYLGEKSAGPEGCLSVPGRSGLVERYEAVEIRHRQVSGNRFHKEIKTTTETVTGYTAIIFQHETDHLDGIIYTDRATELTDSEQ